MQRKSLFQILFWLRIVTTETNELKKCFHLLSEIQQKVELEGVEPSSKQGNYKLSTCLSSLSFSYNGKTEATNHYLILCYFITHTRL